MLVFVNILTYILSQCIKKRHNISQSHGSEKKKGAVFAGAETEVYTDE